MSTKARLVVLISGSGSNLQAILDACKTERLNAEVMAVISNREKAYGLTRAMHAQVQTEYIPWKPYKLNGKSRRDYDADLANSVEKFKPDFVVLAGWMRLLTLAFVNSFPMRVINLHPALPGMFPGTHAIERAFQAFQDGEIQETGVMVHFVPNEGVDDGPLIAKQEVPIFQEDDLESLTERVHQTEHKLLITALATVIARKKIEN